MNRCGDCQFFEECSKEYSGLGEEARACADYQGADDKTRVYRAVLKRITEYMKTKEKEK